MKTAFNILAAAAFLTAAPSRCLALWEIETVSKERAKELGMEVRSSAAGPNQVRVELEFKLEGDLKNFSGVELSLGSRDKPVLTAPLREERSKPGRIIVSFTASAAQLDKLTLSVSVPGGLGGSIYELRVRDFVERNGAKTREAAQAEDETAKGGRPAAKAREAAAELSLLEEVETLEAQRESRMARLKAAQVAVKIAEVHAANLARGAAPAMEAEKARLEVEAAKAQYEIRVAEVKEIDVKIKFAKKRLEMVK